MRTIRIDERRARLGRRHRLAGSTRIADPVALTRSLVALHATDPATVYLTVTARSPDPTVAAIEKALYDDRTLLRMLGMRRTVFVVADELAPVIHTACTTDVAARERKLLTRHLTEAGIAPDQAAADVWLKDVQDETAAALRARGAANAGELGEDVPRLRERLTMAEGKSYSAQPMITSRVLGLLAAEGRIVRGRPRGTWLSTQYSWSPVEKWVPGGLADVPADQARAELARQWLDAFGPATLADLRWWAGWTAAHARQALRSVGAVEVDLGDETGFVLPDDLDEVTAPEPWVALLPALDPTPMGWKQREWYLGEHKERVFDTFGNVGPTVWADGRIVGGWAVRPDGTVVTRLLDDIGSAASDEVDAEAARLTAWLAGTRIIPRFRTPLERELADS